MTGDRQRDRDVVSFGRPEIVWERADHEEHERREDDDPEDAATDRKPRDPDRDRQAEDPDENHLGPMRSKDGDRRPLALREVLVAVRKVSGERDGGREESQDDGREKTRDEARPTERHRGTNRHDRTEGEERRNLADSPIAELQRWGAVTPREERTRVTEGQEEHVSCEDHEPEAGKRPEAEARVSHEQHGPWVSREVRRGRTV